MRTTIAARANLELIDQNYQRWQEDPASVDPSWAAFFEGFELGNLPQRNGAAAVAAPRAVTRDEVIQQMVRASRITGSPEFPADEEDVAARAARAYDRSYDPAGVARQAVATVASWSSGAAGVGLLLESEINERLRVGHARNGSDVVVQDRE